MEYWERKCEVRSPAEADEAFEYRALVEFNLIEFA